MRVTLIPESHPRLEKIIISDQFLSVGRGAAPFSQYEPSAIGLLSRRHAKLFINEEHLYVVDLGSRNGTKVNDVSLKQQPIELRSGDKICFGGELTYRVQIEEPPDLGSPLAADNTAILFAREGDAEATESKTAYVATANRFLNVFCDQQQVSQAANTEKTTANCTRKRQPDSDIAKRKPASWSLWWLGAAALVTIVALALYLRDSPEREIKMLFDQGRYPLVVAEAKHYLDQHPNNQIVKNLLTQAVLKELMPKWMNHLKRGEFLAAMALLEDAESNAAGDDSFKTSLELLRWVQDIESFFYDRGGLEAPVVMFSHERIITTLLQRWDANTAQNRQVLTALNASVPEFESLGRVALSHMSQLRRDQSVYVSAIEKLHSYILKSLERGQVSSIKQELDTFEEKYPRVQGVESIRADLQDYEQLEQAKKTGDLQRLSQLREELDFRTPIFKEWDKNLPQAIGVTD